MNLPIEIEWENGVEPGTGSRFSGSGTLLSVQQGRYEHWTALVMQDDGKLVEFRIVTSITKMHRKVRP